MAFSREGFTIDVVSRFARKALFNPAVVLLIALPWALMYSEPYLPINPVLLTRLPKPEWPWIIVGSVWGLFALTLHMNDYLNDAYANNWTMDNTWNWNEETVLVTGGSSGIGANVVQNLLTRNPNTTIIVLDYTPLKWTPPPKSKIHYYQCDLSNSATIRNVSAKVRSEVGNPTVLMNNAGLARGSTVMEGSYADVEATIRTNLIAPFLLTKEFLPYMVKKNHGHVVNMSSMSSIMPPARIADYAATKAGLNALHESLQLELKNMHKAPKVRLTLGIFSFIRTPMFKGETKMSNFFFPLLHVETVGEQLVDILYSGRGRTLYMPGIARFLHTLRALPEWLIRIARDGSRKMGVDFRGRQRLDEKTGGLAYER
ncbi:hypothetical protein SCAR479_06409 [Seiridium cardinale]|uniref:Uncharacterized protein n=1 Tax=Seiridium cardinale TaxID=138064 RepID=A0ABR2XT80_9PEZI